MISASTKKWLTRILSLAAILYFIFPRPVKIDKTDYAQSLIPYLNAPYVWGGESEEGIDCSGLARRGMIAMLLKIGLASRRPSYLLMSYRLLTQDQRARDWLHLTGFTRPLDAIYVPGEAYPLETGDLLINPDGKHVVVYLNNKVFIEASFIQRRVQLIHESDLKTRQPHFIVARWKFLENI